MPHDGELGKIAREAVSMVRGKSVLDIGTGFGIVVDHVLSSTCCNIVSIDPESWRFDKLSEKYRKYIQSGRLRLLRQSIEDFKDDRHSFDTTISISALHHFSDPAAGMRNMETVTVGRVIVADWNGRSSGVLNPHKPEDMERAEYIAIEYMQRNSYRIKENKYWYIGWKDL